MGSGKIWEQHKEKSSELNREDIAITQTLIFADVHTHLHGWHEAKYAVDGGSSRCQSRWLEPNIGQSLLSTTFASLFDTRLLKIPTLTLD
jgi:hypothetical protein